MIGARIGPCRVVEEIGRGGMGRVFRAVVEDAAPGLPVGAQVAVKVLHPHLVDSPVTRARFVREARLGRSVEHPNVVRTHDAGTATVDGDPCDFLVMELVEGQSLRDALAEMARVPEGLCRHIGREVARGLAAIHAAGAVHRDLKPENVLLTRDHAVKVMDLGVAHVVAEALRLSASGEFVGSVRYAAPEQFRGSEVDARADLHALGAVLYELATASAPFSGDEFRTVMRNVLEAEPPPPSLRTPRLTPFFDAVVARLLAKDPADRFASADEVARVLGEGESSAWWTSSARRPRDATRGARLRIDVPRETSVHGREAELDRLRAALTAAAAGGGRVVLVEGETGVGKTRFADEFLRRLEATGEPVHALYGGFAPGGAATAHEAFVAAIRAHLGDGDVEAAVRPLLPEIPLLVPSLAAFLRGDVTPPGSESLTRESLRTAFVLLLRRLAAERTTVLVVDDLHRAPDEGRALFAALAAGAPGHRLLVVGTLRSGADEPWSAAILGLRHADAIPLGRLGPRDLGLLLTEALRSERVAEEIGWQIARKSDGNPYFVFEILGTLRETRLLAERPDGTWAATRAIGDFRIPSSIVELIGARIAGLADDERRVLEAAACCGFEFDPLLVAEALAQPRIAVLRTLAGIERRHRLVRASGRRFAFDHPQVREALYDGMPDPLRESWHASVADALERRTEAAGGDGPAGQAAVDLCDHLLRAGDGARAMPHLAPALAHLFGNHLHDAGVALARRALGAEGLVRGTARAELLLREAAGLDILGRRTEQGRALDEAVALAGDARDEVLEIRARNARAWLLTQTGRASEAEPLLVAAADAARRLGNRAEEARALGNLGNVCWSLGRYDEAFVHHTRNVEIAVAVGDRSGEALALGNLGNVLWGLGRFEEARAHHQRNAALGRELGNLRTEAIATGNLGCDELALGRLDAALGLLRRSLDLSRGVGDRRAEAFARGNLGSALTLLGRTEEAEEETSRYAALSTELSERMWEALAAANLAAVRTVEGRPDDARTLLRGAVERLRSLGARAMLADVLVQSREVDLDAGRPDGAGAALREALALARESGLVGAETLALVHLARLPDGDVRAAEEALERHGFRLMHSARMTAQFRLFQVTGRPERLAEAKRLLEDAVEHAPAEDRRTMVARVPVLREIAAAAT